jgi:RHS repeat-associated protein
MRIIKTLLVVLSVAFSVSSKAQTNLVPDHVELAVLKNIYDSLGGPSWTNKGNWPTSGNWPATATAAQFGTWWGVTVVNGDITQIALATNKLAGVFPKSITQLQSLVHLTLHTNQISGSLPSSISSLVKLQTLNLESNQLTGVIPGTIGTMTNLKTIRLTSNGLSGALPSSITNISGLQVLRVSSNGFNAIPDLSALTNLTELGIGGLSNVSAGPLYPWLSALTKLTYLDCAASKRSGGIELVYSLKNLRHLYLQYNTLSGSLSSEIGELSGLIRLYLYNNQFSGSIPEELGSLSMLLYLYLQDNKFSGSIPKSIGALKNVVALNFFNNKLSGAIPSEVGDMEDLQTFNVSNNNLTGPIPQSLGNLAHLSHVFLQYNSLEGSIPSGFWTASKLMVFNASQNRLSGTIPNSLNGLVKLEELYLNGNALSGNLPASIGSLSRLKILNLASNQFSGDLPSEISGCTALVTLTLDDNKFTSIPSTILGLPLLSSIKFNQNELTNIPAFQNHVNKSSLGLQIGNNRLDYSHIAPLVGAGLASFSYTTQRPKDIVKMSITHGQAFSIPSRPGNYSTLVWEKYNGHKWEVVTANNQSATPTTFSRTSATAADEGLYRWKMTNTNVPGTSVESEPIELRSVVGDVLNTWAFQYKYDGRNRMIEKKVPGADWVYMVYDDRDRLVLTQDGEQRKVNKWMFTKYDALNRPVYTGLYTHGSAQSQEVMSGEVSKTVFAETYNGLLPHGYSTGVFPTGNQDVHTVTYYDDYAFMQFLNGAEFNYKAGELPDQAMMSTRVKGQVTGTKTKVLYPAADYGTSRFLLTVNYYDDKYRLIQTVSENETGTVTRITNVYDFVGKVLQTKTSIEGDGFVKWKDLTGVEQRGNKLLRTKGSSDETCGAASVQLLPANSDGWLEFQRTTAHTIYVGLSDANTNTLSSSIDYCVRVSNTSGYVMTENGGGSVTAPGIQSTGDMLRFERKSGVVTLKRNGVLLHTFPTTSTGTLMVDATMFSSGSELAFAKLHFGATPQSITRTFKYDHAGRLLETWHAVNSEQPVLLARNEYNELGQLVTKKLHSTADINSAPTSRNYKQHVDYRYNIRGWLTRINNSDLSKENTTDAAEPGDYFGMNLGYNDDLGLGTYLPQYNGNISAIKYSTGLGLGFNDAALEIFEPTQRGYKFEYDPMNRLKHANPVERTVGWNPSSAYYEGSLDYDLNGNITALSRRGENGSTMDVLRYTYQGNQLLKVEDDGDPKQGFVDGLNVDDDYTYDMNGNMSMDKNKSINAAGIKYNVLNLPQEVMKSTGEKLVYVYDATGRKLAQNVFSAAGVNVKKTSYVGEYIYENDTAKIILHDEGRVIPELDGTFTYDYNLKDHLGNNRLTFTTKEKEDVYTATMEPANEESERSTFLDYNSFVNDAFDHTDAGTVHQYVHVLNGGNNSQIGMAKSFAVVPGDNIKATVYVKYSPVQGQGGNLVNFAAALTGAFNLSPTMPGEAGSAYSALEAYGAGIASGGRSDEEPNWPKGYLNILVFDKDFNLVDFAFEQVNTTCAQGAGALVPHQKLSRELTIRHPGYAYVFLSNESPYEQYMGFDDMEVVHKLSDVIQQDEYYPFGLTYNSYSRENSTAQDYKYNGREEQTELNLSTYDYGARMYDPAIGRWWQEDPFSNAYYSYSPYSYVTNNPVIYIDENGQFKIPIHRRITQNALNRLGFFKRWFRFDLLAGNTIIADVFGAGEDRHFDGRNNFT